VAALLLSILTGDPQFNVITGHNNPFNFLIASFIFVFQNSPGQNNLQRGLHRRFDLSVSGTNQVELISRPLKS